MPVISDQQAKTIAQGITAVGGINYYGGGHGQASAHAQSTPLTLAPAKAPAMNLWQKLGAVATQTANIAGSAAKGAANFVKNTPKYVYRDVQPFLQGVASTVTGEYTKDLKNISDQNKQLEKNQRMYTQLYKSGKMSKENYARLMKDLAMSYQDLSKESTKIAAKTDRGDVVESAAMTAADILAVGRFTGSRAVTKQVGARALRMGGRAQLASVVASEATNLERLATQIPAVRALVLRNAEILAKDGVKAMAGEAESQFIKRAGKDLAIGLILKRPIVYQTNIGSAKDVYSNILEGDYNSAVKTAALQATQLLEGGPIGAFMRAGGWLKNKVRDLSYGTDSLIDNLSREIGTKEPKQIATYLQSLDRNSDEFKNAEKIYRIMQETNLRVSDENVGAAVRNILSNYDYAGIPRESITPQKLVQDYQNWHEAAKLVDGLSRVKGLNADELRNLVVVRWDSVMKRGLAGAILRAGDDRQAMANVLSEYAGKSSNGWSNNPTLMAQLVKIVNESASAEEAAARIKAIPTALAIPKNIPKGVSKKLSELGYGVAVPEGGIRKTPIVDYNDTRKLISSVTEGPTTTTRTVPVEIPKKLTKLVEEAKSYNSVEEFVAAQKAKMVTTYKTITKQATETASTTSKEAPSVPKLIASRTMALGKPGVKGNSKAVYGTSDANLTQIIRSAIIAAKGTAKTAEEHAAALYDAGFSDADIKAIRDFAVKNAADNGEVDASRLQTFIESRIGSKSVSPSATTTERVATTVPANIDEGDARKAYELAHTEPTTETISNVVESDRGSNIFEAATAPMPVFGTIATGLEKAGLSPRSASQVASRQLAQSVVASLDEANVARGLGFTNMEGNVVTGGQVILSKLQKYVNDTEATLVGRALTFGKARSALTDIRQMTISEVSKALGVSHSDARAVSKAVMKGYTETPLEYRGLGDHIIDYAFRINPLQKYYSRIQSALRYSYNPFFALQEGVETSVFSGANGGNRITNLVSNNLMWNKSRAELNSTVELLDKSGIFSSSLAGEAAQDLVLGRLTADITPAQKRDLAGLALDMAKNKGKDLQSYLRDNPDEIGDALRIIVQYPRQGFLASSMARTMNVAFFPMRYNLKVTKMAADILAKQPPVIQYAFIHSMLNMKDWLKSDEGIRWQSQHTDAIQVFNWITPINSISSVMNLLGHKPDAIGEIGQLGGLPFGVISQILDSQGIIHLNTPYVNPSTGDVLPKYIPETTKARAATAIQDLLGSMFTYPGRILGLPGKQQTINDVVRSFIDTNGTDFIKEDQMNRLTPLEQNWVRVLKGDTSQEAVDALYTAPTPGQFNWYTIPPLNVPQPFVAPSEVQVTTKSQIAAEKAAKKAVKKAATGGRTKPVAKPVGQY